MRILKRNLAFVLAMIMALSLTAGAANVVEYTDHNDIAFTEAVEVLSAMGVLEGTDGVFNPTKVLNRAEAAKIIAYLMLGEETASNLKAAEAPFVDVPTNHWAAGYIAYCVRAGIVKGVSATEFAPKADLTATQFAAMLLRACGYGQNGEYEGFGWDVEVNKDALTKEIYKNNLGVDFGAGATREEAALYAFNTLNVANVEFIKTLEIYTAAGYTMADLLIPNWNKVDKDDAFGRDGKVWVNDKGEEVTNVMASEAKKVYTAATAYKTIYADLGLTKDTVADVYENSKNVTDTLTLTKTAETKTAYGNNTVIEAYVDANKDVKLIVVETKLGTVSKYTEAKGEAKAKVTVDGKDFETETKYEKDDKVLYTMADGVIKSVKVAETVTGKVTAKTANYVKLDGTKYNFAKNADTVALSGLSFAEATIAVDNGYAYYVVAAKDEKFENVDGYVKVIDSLVAQDKFGTEVTGGELKVKFFADGETVVLPVLAEKKDDVLKFKTVGTDDLAAWTPLTATELEKLENKVFGYTMTEDEEIVLHDVSDVIVHNAKTTVNFEGKRAFGAYRLNNATVATVVEKEGVETFTGYEAIKFAATDVEVLYVLDGAMMKEIFILGDLTAASNDEIVVYYNGDAEQVTKDTHSIVLYAADGEKLVDVIVDNADMAKLTKGNAYNVKIDTENKLTYISGAHGQFVATSVAKDGMSFSITANTAKTWYINEDVTVWNVTDGIVADKLENGDKICFNVDAKDGLAVTELFIIAEAE